MNSDKWNSKKYLLGHGLSLHERSSTFPPRQSRPPKCGEGLVQVRVRLCTPPPQVTLQTSQYPQSVQFPSTVEQITHQLKEPSSKLWTAQEEHRKNKSTKKSALYFQKNSSKFPQSMTRRQEETSDRHLRCSGQKIEHHWDVSNTSNKAWFTS